MRTIIILAFGLFFIGSVQAQVGSSISADGSAPNNNAMLDVQSPTTGDGKGILIPRVTLAQRTTASSTLAGGLLDNSGNLRGGAAQGLIVYQTDGAQGLYFNTSQTATPSWAYLGDIAGLLVSNVWAVADSTTNYLPRTGGTMSGALNMGAQIVSNTAYIDFNGNDVSVGRGANGAVTGAAVGASANGYNNGVAMGWNASGSSYGAAVGYLANGYNFGAAVGYQANGYNGVAVGDLAKGSSSGAAVGREANGSSFGAAVGYQAKGTNYGVAVGTSANGSSYGAAMGYNANGARTNVAIGLRANAGNGTNQIAIGNNVTNNLPNTARIRGSLYLDGGSSIYTNAGVFGSSSWGIKAFTIPHPLDPENKVLRHFCLEGPAVWNVYAGNAQLVNGQAVVHLPDYYSALNLVGSEIYSLTPISSDLQIAVIKQEVINNRFVIGGSSDMKVSWTIKVLRNDPGCREDLKRRPVEQFKRDILNSRTEIINSE